MMSIDPVRTRAYSPKLSLPPRSKIETFAGLEADAFQQMLINEYRLGAGISWQRDKPHF